MKNLIKDFVKILEHCIWQVTFMYFFFKELQQTKKEHSSLEKFWYFFPITLQTCYSVFNYNLYVAQNSQENS